MSLLAWLKTTFHPPVPPPALPSQPIEPACIHQYIEEQARRTPGNAAVVFQDRQLTYSDLNRRANQLAHFLRKRGVGAESVVGLGLTRSEMLIVALLAIWKAGAAYVPLESKFPRERLLYTIADSQPILVLTEESLRDYFDNSGAESLFVDSAWKEISRESDQNPKPVTTAENLAQLLYTSGSTGRPKGVEILHRGLVNFMNWIKVEPGVKETDTVIATTVITFDTSAVELFMPLTVGARIVMLGREAMGTRSFFDSLEKHAATVIQGTPSVLQWFDELQWPGKKDLKIISGGEALSRETAEKLLPKCGELWNIYGPAETTVWSTLTQVHSGAGPVPIGHAICNTQILLLDSNLQPVKQGEEGEICIGGAGVARGYHNRPEETAARFIKSPFDDGQGRIYRTGDLGRLSPSGDLEYCGRMDHQIKINGERIEPGEIEFAIEKFPGIRKALVIAREDVPGEKRLVGYVIPQNGLDFEPQELRRFLMNILPPSLIPAQFVPLPEFPLLINGKIDRNALPKPGLPSGKNAM